MFYARDKRMAEGPVAAIGGALLGGLIGGGGTLAGILTTGGLIGASLGLMGGSLLGGGLGQQMPSYSATPAPKAPATPGAPGLPGAGAGDGGISTPTAEEVARGEMERKRRGRVATILSEQRKADDDTELLGGELF